MQKERYCRCVGVMYMDPLLLSHPLFRVTRIACHKVYCELHDVGKKHVKRRTVAQP